MLYLDLVQRHRYQGNTTKSVVARTLFAQGNQQNKHLEFALSIS